ncbi:hypothetical protein [Streptomyces sp. NPDC046821]|uniref:hypothetical protein n=1 Tax=Streptomyces sp. NPDC046821 TaxID=3154702 RepID=UPI00340971DD
MNQDPAQDEADVTMAVAIHGVLREHPWIGQVSADHDLDEDLFSLAVKRAAAYGFSSTRFSAGAELGGQRWAHADAGGDWSQDGRERQLAWLTVYPATGLRHQQLPVLPMTRVLVDALRRVGTLEFTGLSVSAPLRLAADARFDLVGDAAWYALAAPDARTRVLVTVNGVAATAQHLCEQAHERGHGLLKLDHAPNGLGSRNPESGAPTRPTFVCDVPEWTPDAAAWLAAVFVDSLRATGVRGTAEIEVTRFSH